jgi:hypothetical protein
MIQDFILGFIGILFTIGLIPQVLLGFKVKRPLVSLETSAFYVVLLTVNTICFYTLELYWTSLFSYTTMVMWFIILLQTKLYGDRYGRYRKVNRRF